MSAIALEVIHFLNKICRNINFNYMGRTEDDQIFSIKKKHKRIVKINPNLPIS